MIRAEIRNLERLGPLPTDDDDYPGIDRELLDFELLLAAIDPPITMEEARVLASLFPEDGSTSYGLAWSLVHLIGTLSINEPFSPGGPLDWRGSARWCGKDWAGWGWCARGPVRDSVF